MTKLFTKITLAASASLILWSLFCKLQTQFVRDQFTYPDVNLVWNDGFGTVLRVSTFVTAILSSYVLLFLICEGEK